jgi:hypothetical protein
MQSGTEAASRNVLVWHLANNARVILRPSGTEPKCKVYVETSSAPGSELTTAMNQASQQCQALADAFVLQMLATVDICLPKWALCIEDLVSIEDKQRFVSEVLPHALEHVDPQGSSAETQAWLQAALAQHGPKGHLLYTAAVQAYVHKNRPANGEALVALFS